MVNIFNPVRCFVICLTVTFILMITACSSGISIEVTPVSQALPATETSEPTPTKIEAIPTVTASTATATPNITPLPTLLPSPSPTDTATPTPVISNMKKSGELPIGSIPLPILGVSADGTLLAISARDTEDILYIFDMITQTVQWEIVEDDTGGTVGYSSLTFSPDNRYLTGWDGGFSMFIWDMFNGEVIFQIGYSRDWEASIRSASFSPNSQLLAVSSFNNPVMIYRMTTGELVDEFPSFNIVTYPPTDGGDHFLKPGHLIGDYFEVEFIPNYASLLAIAIYPYPFIEGEGIAGGIYFWDMEAQSLENVISGEGGFSVMASPNGQLLVAAIDNQIIGWDIENANEVFTIENSEEIAYPISITDAGFFVTLSRTEGLNVWDFDGKLMAILNPDVPVGDAVFLPDGRLLVAYLDENSPIEIWEITE